MKLAFGEKNKAIITGSDLLEHPPPPHSDKKDPVRRILIDVRVCLPVQCRVAGSLDPRTSLPRPVPDACSLGKAAPQDGHDLALSLPSLSASDFFAS